MLPDPLNAALPAIVRSAAAHVVADAVDPQLLRDHVWPVADLGGAVRVAADPRLAPGYEWPAAERPHVIALAYERGTTDGLDVGCHRLRGGVRT